MARFKSALWVEGENNQALLNRAWICKTPKTECGGIFLENYLFDHHVLLFSAYRQGGSSCALNS